MYVCTYECMYACMHGWMDVWMYGCMDVWMYGCMDAWMHGCMDARMYGWMDGWTDGCMDGWMDVRMYGCMDILMFGCMDVCMCVCMYDIYIYTYAQPLSQNPPLQLPFCDTLNCSQWSKYHTWCASHYGKCFLCKKWVGVKGCGTRCTVELLGFRSKTRIRCIRCTRCVWSPHKKGSFQFLRSSSWICRIVPNWDRLTWQFLGLRWSLHIYFLC